MFHDLTWSSNVLDTCGKVEYITGPVKGPLRTCGGGGRNPPEHFMPPFNIVFKRQNEATFYLKWAFYNTYFESWRLHLNKADKRLFLGLYLIEGAGLLTGLLMEAVSRVRADQRTSGVSVPHRTDVRR